MSYTVTFRNVGRGQATFSDVVKKIDERSLLRVVRKHLASRGIEFSVNEEARTGHVIVGGFRVVGEFTWEQVA